MFLPLQPQPESGNWAVPISNVFSCRRLSLPRRRAKTSHRRMSFPTTTAYFYAKGPSGPQEYCIDSKLHIFKISHAGIIGQRRVDPIWNILRTLFTWTNKHALVSLCLHCVIFKSANKVPRPLSSEIHATKANKVIHFDYMRLRDSSNDEK